MSENRGVPVLYCSPWRTPVSLSPGREQVTNIVCVCFFFSFNTILSLWVTLSPHFLSFFLRRSLSVRRGLVFLPAWRGPAALSLPFILLTTCHSSLSAGWVLTAGLGAQEFWKVVEGIAVLDFPDIVCLWSDFFKFLFHRKICSTSGKRISIDVHLFIIKHRRVTFFLDGPVGESLKKRLMSFLHVQTSPLCPFPDILREFLIVRWQFFKVRWTLWPFSQPPSVLSSSEFT